MTSKEMFEALGYEQVTNNDNLIKYMDDNGKYVSFIRMCEEYEVGYYDGYARRVSIKEHEAITKQMKELGWI